MILDPGLVLLWLLLKTKEWLDKFDKLVDIISTVFAPAWLTQMKLLGEDWA